MNGQKFVYRFVQFPDGFNMSEIQISDLPVSSEGGEGDVSNSYSSPPPDHKKIGIKLNNMRRIRPVMTPKSPQNYSLTGQNSAQEIPKMENMVQQHKVILQQYNDLLLSYQLQCMIAQASVRYIAQNNSRAMVGFPQAPPTLNSNASNSPTRDSTEKWSLPSSSHSASNRPIGEIVQGNFSEDAIVPQEGARKRGRAESQQESQPLDLSKPKKIKINENSAQSAYSCL